jgi:hypothetical protein
VFLADRLFQLESQQPPTTRSEADQRAALQRKLPPASEQVAEVSLTVITALMTGHVVDVRR